jgi:hypothetical protein
MTSLQGTYPRLAISELQNKHTCHHLVGSLPRLDWKVKQFLPE